MMNLIKKNEDLLSVIFIMGYFLSLNYLTFVVSKHFIWTILVISLINLVLNLMKKNVDFLRYTSIVNFYIALKFVIMFFYDKNLLI